MNRRVSPESARAATRTKAVSNDSHALAAERLGAQRPLRSRQLQQIDDSISQGRLEFAEKQLTEHLGRRPDDADAISLMGRVQLRLGRAAQAASLLERCLELAPDFAAARFNYAELLLRLKRIEDALEQIDLLLESDGSNPLFRQLKANILELLGKGEQSLALYEQLVAENPYRMDSWVSYGDALRAAGLQGQSVVAYRRAIEINPSSGKAYWSLANMKTVRLSDSDIAEMQDALSDSAMTEDDRIQMLYALGKAYEDLDMYDRSFDYYAKGNAAMRVRMPYNPDSVTKLVARSKALFTPEFFRGRSGVGCKASDAIFVLGVPRSGSTLIEQILSSHSAIEGTEELPYVPDLARRLEDRAGKTTTSAYPDVLAALEPEMFARLGEEYLQRARVHRKLGRPNFVDKEPPNFFHIGLIHLMLPNAKIIDARRHPAACSWSQFRQYFKKVRLRQAELGRFYRDYVELMAHFDRVLPGKIHRIIYEDMVANPEAEIRKLLAFLELPFEMNCLHFYETKRTVLTPSSEQVRRPISADAVDHWRNYEPWLGPLLKSLGSVLTAYPDIPEELR